MVNSFVNHNKKQKLLRAADITEREGFPIAGSDRTAFNNVMVQQVLQYLEEFPARQRVMFVMKHQEGLTYEEIADSCGTSVGTVKQTIFRVVEKLRQKFHSPGIQISEGSSARLSEIP
jgi:RNA polymerase sigma factor (sigma-70 family)